MKNCERSEQEIIMIFSFFSGNFGKKYEKKKFKKKIVLTDRPLFGISSPVEQFFFFSWPKGV